MTNKKINEQLKSTLNALNDYAEDGPSDHVEILTCLSSITIFLAEIAKRLPEVKGD